MASQVTKTEVAPRRVVGEAIAFVAIGGIAALGYVVLAGTMVPLLSGIPAPLVSFCCYALFILPVYFAHRRFSFRTDAPHARALPRYLATQALGLVLAGLFSILVYSVAKLSGLVASAVVIGLTSVINFAVLKLWTFAHVHPQRSNEDYVAQTGR